MHPYAACALALFSTALLHAQSTAVSYGTELPCGTMGQGALRPRVQLNAANTPVVLWGRNGPNVNFAAVGNGTSFSAAAVIHPAGLVPSVADWMGSALAAEGNTIWAVLKGTPEDEVGCYVVRSDDGGYTWGDTLRADAQDGTLARFPSIAVVPGAGPVVQYMQFTSGFDEARYVTRHMMGGVFMAPLPLSAPFSPGYVCDCCPGQIEADGNTVVGLYRNAGSNQRVIWGASSTNGGMDFENGAMLDETNWTISSCPSSGPDAYMAGDSVRYVWMSGAGGTTRVYIRSAHLPELTPGTQRKVQGTLPGGITQNFPRIAGSADTLGVVWQHIGGGNSAILFSYSVAGSFALGAPDTLALADAGDVGTPDIAYANGTFHIVWSDNAMGVVRYRSATLVNTTAVPETRMGSALRVWPTPTSDILHVSGAATTYQLLDALGHEVLRQRSSDGRVDVSAVAPGSYSLVALDSAGSPVGTARVVLVR